MLRIVAGRYRGRRLHTAAGRWLRPTADRIKESIFNILQDELRGARVLDLFAGSGNLGLEALSRGAQQVVLVESNADALKVIRRNLEVLGVQEGQEEVEVVRADALRYLRARHPEPFDVILADPPYAAGVEQAVLDALPGSALKPGGWFVLQHAREWCLEKRPARLRHWRSKRFGATVVDILIYEEEG